MFEAAIAIVPCCSEFCWCC